MLPFFAVIGIHERAPEPGGASDIRVDDRDAEFDFDGALHGLDVVHLHDVDDFDALAAERLVDGAARGDVGFETDESFAPQRGERNRAAGGQRMPGRADEHELVAPERDDFETALLHGVRHQAHVAHVAQHVLVDPVCPVILHVDIDRAVGLQEALQVRREIVEADGVNRRDPQRAGHDIAELLELGSQRVVRLDDLLAVLVQNLALARQAKLLLAALDERRAELVLQGADLLAHRRLGDVIDLCRLGEALGFR